MEKKFFFYHKIEFEQQFITFNDLLCVFLRRKLVNNMNHCI